MRSTAHRLVMVYAVAWLPACGGPTAPGPSQALSSEVLTEHYRFVMAAGDTVDGLTQEAFHRWCTDLLGTDLPARIEFRKYRNRAHLQALTGIATNGFAEPDALVVHSIFPSDGHEAVHVLTAPIGRPSDFWNEGLAVALDRNPEIGRPLPLWNDRPLDDVVRDLRAAGQVPALATMMTTDAFRSIDDSRGYPIAGAFVSFLLDRYGVDALLDQCRGASRDDSLAAIRQRFTQTYGRPLEALEAEWVQGTH